MSTLKQRLDRVDLSTNSRDTSTAIIELLRPHVPHSLNILGTLLNTGHRSSTLQNVDPSQVSLWSTVPFHSDTISPTTNCPTLFSVVIFSHLNHQFRFFCSAESRASDDQPTEEEETHVKQVIEYLLEIVRDSKAWSTYNSTLVSLGFTPRNRVDTDPPVIVIGAVHAKWAHVLASTSTFQNPHVRYVFPPRVSFPLQARDDLPLAPDRRTGTPQSGDGLADMEVSQIREFDLPFVWGTSSIPRSDAYILSRAPYSVCLRFRGGMGADEEPGQPVACALIHVDGSIGTLYVNPRYQRHGFGRLVIQALRETLDFSKGLDDPTSTSTSDGHRDLGGGALGWNWTDTAFHNEAGNRFFTSLVGRENTWVCHWTYVLVNPSL